MKNDERTKFLEGSIHWMRREAMKLMQALERALARNKEMKVELD
jgi:hypothetical protein